MQLVWDELGERTFETGLDRGVLYVDGLDGVAWNGLTNVTESPSGGVARPFYIDGVKYLNLADGEEFEGSITAFYSPEEFDLCDGTIALAPGLFANQQMRRPFCFSFRTKAGNDIDGVDHGYKIHIVYNAMATPNSRTYQSISDDSSVNNLSWNLTTRSIPFPGLLPTAHVTIDSRKVDPAGLARLEAVLYGSELEDARVPMPAELLTLVTPVPDLVVTDVGDEHWSISGADDVVIDNGDGTFTITHENVIDHGDGSYTISSSE